MDRGVLPSGHVGSSTTDARTARIATHLVEAVPDGILVVDDLGRIVFADMEAGRVFGVDRLALLDVVVEDLVPELGRLRHEARRAASGSLLTIALVRDASDEYSTRQEHLEEVRQTAIAGERRRLAHELLDSVIRRSRRRHASSTPASSSPVVLRSADTGPSWV